MFIKDKHFYIEHYNLLNIFITSNLIFKYIFL